VALHHRVLHRRELAVLRQALDADDLRAVELEEELDAGVDGAVTNLAVLAAADQSPSSQTIFVPVARWS
jgi:hypothetical protein